MTEQQPGLTELTAAIEDLRRRIERLEQATMTAHPAVTPPTLPPTYKPLPVARPAAPTKPAEPASANPKPIPLAPAMPEPPRVDATTQALEDMMAAPGGRRSAQPLSTRSAMPSTRPASSGRTFEQTIGTRWMLIAGVVVLLLGGAFFFKLAYDIGWITPMRRMIFGALLGLVMIVGGEIALRRQMRLFGAALIGVGIVWLYQVIYVASPNGIFEDLRAIDHTTAFVLMCGVTLLGVALSLHTRMSMAAIVSLVGAMATPILLSTGQNREVLLYLLVVDAGFLAVAMARRWQSLPVLSLIGTTLVFGGWFGVHYGPEAFATTAAFAWMLAAVHGLYVAAAVRWRRASPELAHAMAVMTTAAMATALLAMPGMELRHAFCLQMLVLGALSAAYAVWQRAGTMTAVVLTALLTAMWMGLMRSMGFQPAADAHEATYSLYAWGFLVMLAGTACLRRVSSGQAHAPTMCVAALVCTAGWLMIQPAALEPLATGQLVAMVVLVLAVGQVQRWRGVNFALLLCGAIYFGASLLRGATPTDAGAHVTTPGMGATYCLWIWPLYLIFLADVLIRAARREPGEAAEPLDAVFSSSATALMFGGTFAILHSARALWTNLVETPQISPLLAAIEHMPLGLYGFVLAAAIIALAVFVRKRLGRRALAYAFLGQGLILATVAVPIHFDRSAVTIAWAAEGVIMMILAKRLRNTMVLALSPAALVLALSHLIGKEMPSDRSLNDVLWSPMGVNIDYGMVLTLVVTAALLLSAGILRLGRPMLAERWLAGTLVAVAAAMYALVTLIKLPAIATTWWWLALVAVLGACAFLRRSSSLAALTSFALAATILKYIFPDTMGNTPPQIGPPEMFDAVARRLAWTVVLNWQFGLGVALAAAAIVWRRLCLARNLVRLTFFETAISLAAALPVLWAGSMEVHRFFYGPASPSWTDPYQGMHVSLSLWWGLYAAALLGLGFLYSRTVVRYIAIALFAVLIGKVFIVDLARIHMVYRVLSLMGLGVLLLAGSLLYHRQLRGKA